MNRLIVEFGKYLKLEKGYSDKTLESYQKDLEKFYAYLSKEDLNEQDLTEKDIRNFFQEELMSGVSKRSCARRLSALKHFYKFLNKKKYVVNNPVSLISMPKKDKRNPDVLYVEQVEKLMDLNKKRTDFLAIRDEAIIEVLYTSGIRASELVGIKMNDISLSNRQIMILGKGNKERIAIISNSCADSIKKYLKELRLELLSKCKKSVPPSELFLNNQGDKLTTRGLEYILKKIEEKTGYYLGLHPHIFRHSLATHLFDSGLDLLQIKEILGHESIDSTQVYTHVSDKHIQEEYKKLWTK